MRGLEALGLFRRLPDGRREADIEADIRAELEHHLTCAADELVRQGRTPEEARAEANRHFGDLGSIQRRCLKIQMGERTMLQRIHLAVTFFLFLAVGFLAWTNLESRRAATMAAEMAMAARDEAEFRLQEALDAEQRARAKVDHIVIEVGDQLEIIDSYNSLRVAETVAADGKVLLPEAGWVDVAGLTREEAEKRLTAALRPFFVEVDIKVKVKDPAVEKLHSVEFEAF